MKLQNARPVAASLGTTGSRPRSVCADKPLKKRSFELPANLRISFCDALLIGWIEQELHKLYSRQRSCSAGPLLPDSDTAGLLSVLVFGYASLVFDSEEIAAACRSDPAFARLCHSHPPFAHELRNMRRQARTLLERVLTGVFAQAVVRKFGLTPALLPLELHDDLSNHAAERLDLARHMDTNPAW